jgi:IS30 family transposase
MTEKELTAIERMAAASFTYAEVAEVLEVDIATFEAQMLRNTPERKAYRKGILQRQLELRERIFLDAKNGSGPAQTAAIKILSDTQFKNDL